MIRNLRFLLFGMLLAIFMVDIIDVFEFVVYSLGMVAVTEFFNINNVRSKKVVRR